MKALRTTLNFITSYRFRRAALFLVSIGLLVALVTDSDPVARITFGVMGILVATWIGIGVAGYFGFLKRVTENEYERLIISPPNYYGRPPVYDLQNLLSKYDELADRADKEGKDSQ